MFENIDITKVRNTINFYGKDSSFTEDNNIPELQTRGVTVLCKILRGNKYAYLADEVGMGKTYQAIGVIAMLLKEKPDARILVIAPNSSVQNNWEKEINNFSNNNILEESINLHPQNFNERKDFLNSFKENDKDHNIFLTRLTTFSSIANSIANKDASTDDENREIPIEKLFEGLCNITNEKVSDWKKKTSEWLDNYNTCDSGKICGKFLNKHTVHFDLIIIDEAQNIRNENNATTFLNYWLGLIRFNDEKSNVGPVLKCITSKNINSKYLLLSATPAHRNIDSLRNQLLYFEEKVKTEEEVKSDKRVKTDEVIKNNNIKIINHDFLSTFLIRRLRIYNNENKCNVRNIKPLDVMKEMLVDNVEGLQQRLFLALIQSKLARIGGKNNSTYKIGFLETFESYRPSPDPQNSKEKDFENNGSQEDSEKGEAPDKRMLKAINESFEEAFGEKNGYPPHPKQISIKNEISKFINNNLSFDIEKTNAPDKAIIFVRRLASVKELCIRFNDLYLERILLYWIDELQLPSKINNEGVQKKLYKIQETFEKKYEKKTSNYSDQKEIELDDDIDDDETSKDEDKGSEEQNDKSSKSSTVEQFFNWLAQKKKHETGEMNAVSKFKKSLDRKKHNGFIFTENYYLELFNKDTIPTLVDEAFVKQVNEYIKKDPSRYKGKKKYFNSEILIVCCYIALKCKGKTEIAKFIKDFYEIDKNGKETSGLYEKELNKENVIKILEMDSIWNHLSKYGVNCDLNSGDELYKREILKAITEKYLKSSEAILELLYSYNTERNDLCELIIDRLFTGNNTHGTRIKKIFEEENSKLIIKQLIGSKIVKPESELKLSFLDSQQWVMPATGSRSGKKGNDSVIKRFNTPFYPDFVVCTDVLKEGINLHLFCNRVYHYGLAWTPGDLEQRIGRVDRFFCQTHRERSKEKELQDNNKNNIEVIYPYLGKSVDEQQLKQVLKFKISADILLDSKIRNKKDIQDELEELPIEELIKYTPENLDNCPYSGENILNE